MINRLRKFEFNFRAKLFFDEINTHTLNYHSASSRNQMIKKNALF